MKFTPIIRFSCSLLTMGLIHLNAVSSDSTLVVSQDRSGFPLSVSGKSVPIYVSSVDFPGVIKACKDLQTDIGRVTNASPALYTNKPPKSGQIVIA